MADNNKELDNLIKECIEEVKRENIREHVKGMVTEALAEIVKEAENSLSMKRKNVMKMLQDPKYDHASLAYKLYHPIDQSEKDTARSLFSKKVTGKPDADGVVRSFSDEEITTLYQELRKN